MGLNAKLVYIYHLSLIFPEFPRQLTLSYIAQSLLPHTSLFSIPSWNIAEKLDRYIWTQTFARVPIISYQKLTGNTWGISSVLFSHTVVSDSLRAHGTVACQTSLSITNLELTQTYPSSQWCHPTISSPSPPTFNLSQHQGLFQWVSSSHQVAKLLELQLQHQSFQWTLRTHFL